MKEHPRNHNAGQERKSPASVLLSLANRENQEEQEQNKALRPSLNPLKCSQVGFDPRKGRMGKGLGVQHRAPLQRAKNKKGNHLKSHTSKRCDERS